MKKINHGNEKVGNIQKVSQNENMMKKNVSNGSGTNELIRKNVFVRTFFCRKIIFMEKNKN